MTILCHEFPGRAVALDARGASPLFEDLVPTAFLLLRDCVERRVELETIPYNYSIDRHRFGHTPAIHKLQKFRLGHTQVRCSALGTQAAWRVDVSLAVSNSLRNPTPETSYLPLLSI